MHHDIKNLGGWGGICLLVSTLLALAGCRPVTDPLITFRSPDNQFAAVLRAPDRTNAAIRESGLPSIAGNLGFVDYSFDGQRRLYLFQGDIAAGVGGGPDTLLLPQPPMAATQFTADISAFDTTKWRSARVYDQGDCSTIVSWPQIAELLAGALEPGLLDPSQVTNGRRLSFSISPVLKTRAPDLGAQQLVDDDRVIVNARYAFGSIGGCTNAEVTIRFAFGIRRALGTIELRPNIPLATAPQVCQYFRLPGLPTARVNAVEDGNTFDFLGVVDPDNAASPSVFVDVSDVCLAEPSIRGAIEGAIKSKLPDALRDAVQVLTSTGSFRPGSLPQSQITPAERVSCSCDEECRPPTTPSLYNGVLTVDGDPSLGIPGQRHRCERGGNPTGVGFCVPMIEPNRINVRPEGVELVFFEDGNDPQSGAFDLGAAGRALCDVSRQSTPQGPVPRPALTPFQSEFALQPGPNP